MVGVMAPPEKPALPELSRLSLDVSHQSQQCGADPDLSRRPYGNSSAELAAPPGVQGGHGGDHDAGDVLLPFHARADFCADLPLAIDISQCCCCIISRRSCSSVWWAVYSPAGGALRYRDVPAMLMPGLAYVLYVELRGPLAGEYPYTILDPGFALGPAARRLCGGGGQCRVLVALVAIFDLLLVFIDGLVRDAAAARLKGAHAKNICDLDRLDRRTRGPDPAVRPRRSRCA